MSMFSDLPPLWLTYCLIIIPSSSLLQFPKRCTLNSSFSVITHLVQYPGLKFKVISEALILQSETSHPLSHTTASEQNLSQTLAKPWLSLQEHEPGAFLKTRAVSFFLCQPHYVLNSLVSSNTCILKPVAHLQCKTVYEPVRIYEVWFQRNVI